MDDDLELDMIMARKRRELLAMAAHREGEKGTTAPPAEDPVDVLRGALADRGDEVLNAALSQHPKETRRIAGRLAGLIKGGAVSGKITGEQLLWLFRQLGLNVRLDTKIYVEQDGRFVPLMDAMKKGED